MFDYDKLAELIDKSGKSKAHLCRKMGKPEYYLRDVLTQKTIIPDDLQIILAKELGTTVEFLNGIEEKEKSPTPDGEGLTETQKKAWELIRNLDDEKLIAFLKMMGG